MNLEQLLNRFTHNVESIIQWIFLFILALSGVLISRWLLMKKPEGAEAGAGLSPEINTAIQQILERTAKLEGVTTQPMTPEAVALADTQVQGLKKELASREEELKTLKAAGGGGAAVSDEANKLAARLKELEAKLAEYEILEDDIADLSLYKEENVRLRGELEKLKGGAAPASAPPEVQPSDVAAAIAAAGGDAAAPAAPAAPPAEVTGAPVAPDHDIVAEFASAVGAEPAEPAAPITMEVPSTGNPMQDFEAAVQIEKKMQGASEAPAAAAPTPAAAAPAPAAAAAPAPAPAAEAAPAASATPPGGSDDLFAEFGESPDSSIDTSSLDTDKMMAEMAALVSLEPAKDSALDEGIDIDKMAVEAGGQKR